jgi:hypothetical protein
VDVGIAKPGQKNLHQNLLIKKELKITTGAK